MDPIQPWQEAEGFSQELRRNLEAARSTLNNAISDGAEPEMIDSLKDVVARYERLIMRNTGDGPDNRMVG